MEIIDYFKKRDSDNSVNEVIHPFAYKDNIFKYSYCFGLGVLAYGTVKSMTELLGKFNEIVSSIKLPSAYASRIVSDMNSNSDYKINDVFIALDTKEKQYTFAADLLNLSNRALWSEEYAQKICNHYFGFFKFSSEEKEFFIPRTFQQTVL